MNKKLLLILPLLLLYTTSYSLVVVGILHQDPKINSLRNKIVTATNDSTLDTFVALIQKCHRDELGDQDLIDVDEERTESILREHNLVDASGEPKEDICEAANLLLSQIYYEKQLEGIPKE